MRWMFISSTAIWVTGSDTGSVGSRARSELTRSKCEWTRIWTCLECRWNNPKWSLMSLVLFCKNQKCSKKDSNNNQLNLEKEGRSWERKLSTCTVGLYYCVLLLRSLAIASILAPRCAVYSVCRWKTEWTQPKKKTQLFFCFFCNLLFQESLFCCARLWQEKKEATPSKTVQLAKQHISKSCD